MNHFLLISIYLFFLTFSPNHLKANPSNSNTKIFGKVINPELNSLKISYLNNLLEQQLITNTVKLTNQNEFQTELDFEIPKMIDIKYGNNTKKIFVEPDDSLFIQFYGESFNETFEMTGSNDNNAFLTVMNNKYPYDKRFQFIVSDQ